MSLTAKEKILNKIKEALINPVPLPFPESEAESNIYPRSTEDDAILFAEEFTKLQGKFAFCVNESDLVRQLSLLIEQQGWKKIYCVEPAFTRLLNALSVQPYPSLPDCDVSVTGCEYLVARTGSMVLASSQASGRTTSVYASIHICIAYNRQLVFEVNDALQFLKEKYRDNFPSFITFATGPSRTADIEKTLVTGVHGPKEVYCFLLEEEG